MKLTTLFPLTAAVASVVAAKDSNGANVTVLSCKVIPGDDVWPARAVWRKAMPEVEPYKATKAGWKQPNYRLDATTVDQVVSAIKFAAQYNVRLSILNSGHDFDGRNDAPNGLALVIRGLKGARVLSSFTPTMGGATGVDSSTEPNTIRKQSQQAYVTFGAGYNTRELNTLLAPSGLFTLGAAHGSVAVAGGWAQMGGHAPFSPRFGMGVDQVVEYKVITADGVLRVANAVSNPDLFWALRGGGGGTYGVVVEATVKAHLTSKVVAAQLFLNTTDFNDKTSIYAAAATFHAKFMEFSDKGASAYYFLYPNAFSVYAMYSGPGASRQWVETNLKPMLTSLGSSPGIDKSTMVFLPIEYPDFLTFFQSVFGGMGEKETPSAAPKINPSAPVAPPGNSSLQPRSYSPSLSKRHSPGDDTTATPRGIMNINSWLLGAKHLSSPHLATVLQAAMPRLPEAELRGQFVGGGKVIALGTNDSTALLPAWRKTYVHILQNGIGTLDSAPLRDFAPDMGAYANEVAPHTPNWRSAFWGTHYPRLAALKRAFDPSHLFWVTPGIDADAWVPTDGGSRLCRAQGPLGTAEWPPRMDHANEGDPRLWDETAGAAFPMVREGGRTVYNPQSEVPKRTVMGILDELRKGV